VLLRARLGDREAFEHLFGRLTCSLRRWARGRLPGWAGQRADTGDVFQDAATKALPHLGTFEPRRRKALQSYLRKAVMNRVRDEMRWAGRRAGTVSIESIDVTAPVSLFDETVDQEQKARYRAALEALEPADRELLVASLELGYSYEQVALATGRSSPDAARMAIRRALLRLAKEMGAR
jgi:RNA polymerase sigma factor (sigma-70 family)